MFQPRPGWEPLSNKRRGAWEYFFYWGEYLITAFRWKKKGKCFFLKIEFWSLVLMFNTINFKVVYGVFSFKGRWKNSFVNSFLKVFWLLLIDRYVWYINRVCQFWSVNNIRLAKLLSFLVVINHLSGTRGWKVWRKVGEWN